MDTDQSWWPREACGVGRHSRSSGALFMYSLRPSLTAGLTCNRSNYTIITNLKFMIYYFTLVHLWRVNVFKIIFEHSSTLA